MSKEAYARDADGLPVEYADPNACSYCGSGAIWAAAGDSDLSVGAEAMKYLRLGLPGDVCAIIPVYNDKETTTQADMLAVFDRAIELYKKENPNES